MKRGRNHNKLEKEIAESRKAIDIAEQALNNGQRVNLEPLYKPLYDSWRNQEAELPIMFDVVSYVIGVEEHLNQTAKIDVDYLAEEVEDLRAELDDLEKAA